MRSISPTTARRLAISRQRLAGPVPEAGPAGMLDVIRDLGCVQLDPINAVDRSQRLVLWSRLGQHERGDLDRLLWQDRSLFEYWAHVASIVATEDFPVHRHFMRTYRPVGDGSVRTARLHAWLNANSDLRQHVLAEISAHGPLTSGHFEDKSRTAWVSDGWTGGRNVSEMLDYLWTKGEVMVAGRSGMQRLWDLPERCLPPWTPRDELDEPEVVRRAAERSLRALGVATPRQISQHFTRGRYPGLKAALAELVATGRIQRVTVGNLPGPWYVHTDELALLDWLEAGAWLPRTTLLSPFDNLICDRGRTELLWDFYFRIEIYVPPAKRQYGYYVLPILHGDQLIGRIDPKMDRQSGTLHIHNVYAEPSAPKDRATADAIRNAITSLADFLGARGIAYGAVQGPAAWRKRLR
jgi:hypothetical protein